MLTLNLVLSLFLTRDLPAAWNSPIYFGEQAPRASIHWVTPSGGLTHDSALLAKTRWLWQPVQAGQPKGGPALEIQFDTRNIPPDWRLIDGTSTQGRLVSIERARGRDTLLKHIVVETFAQRAHFHLKFSTPDGKTENLELAVNTLNDAQRLIQKPKSCDGYNIVVEPVIEYANQSAGILKNPLNRSLFLGLTCYEDYQDLNLYLVRSEDANWAYSDMSESKKHSRTLQFVLEKHLENVPWNGHKIKIRTRDEFGALSEYIVRVKSSH